MGNRLLIFVLSLLMLVPVASEAQGLIQHDFDDGEMGPFVDCTTQNPNYAKVVNNRLRTYWEQTSYSSDNRSTKGAEACGDPIHNGVGYLTYKHCWMGFTMNIDEDYMQGNVGVGGLAQVFGFDHARSQSTWTAMLDMKDGNLAWMDRRGSGDTRADVVIYEDYPRGVDMDIIIHNVLSGNNAGEVEIFVNGNLVYSAYDINIGMGEFDEDDIQTNESSTEFKIGQYNHSDAAANEIRIVDYDNISWYDGEDGYDIVNPNKLESCLKTTARTEAECYDDMFGVKTQEGNEGENLNYLVDGDWAKYESIDLSNINSFEARVSSEVDYAMIEVRLDSLDGDVFASLEVSNTGGLQNWVTDAMNVNRVEGEHDVYLIFTNGDGYLLTLNWFGFSEDVICENHVAHLEAECYDEMSGIQTEDCSEGTLNIGWVHDKDWVMYQDVDLSSMNSIKARVSSKITGNTIEVHLDGVDGELIAEIPVTNTNGNQNWITDSINIISTEGTHDVYLVFGGGDGYLFNLNYLGFSEDRVVVTNIEELMKTSISVFPNPTTGEVKLSIGANYQVVNSFGQEVLSGKGTSVDLTNHPKGIYLIQVGTQSFKIVKE